MTTRILFIFLLFLSFSFAATSDSKEGMTKKEEVKEYIDQHMLDSGAWYPFGHTAPVSIYFPEWAKYYFAEAPMDIMVGYLDNKIDMSPSLHLLMLVFASILMFLLFVILYKKKEPLLAPRGLTNLLELLVLFVRDQIVIPHLGEKDGRRFAPIFLTLFFLILILNYISLVPGMSTATANFSVAMALAGITLLFMFIGGFIYHGPIGFFKAFMPSGVPIYFFPITLTIMVIEMAGLIIKPFALTVRLFANMLAGHLIIFSILGLAIVAGSASGALYSLLALFIYALELLIAFIQAYIFTMLSALFVGSVLHPSH